MSRNETLCLLELKAIGEFPDQQPVPILDPAGNSIAGWWPSWSPDGQWIVFHTDGIGLGLVRPDGTGYRVLVHTADMVSGPDQRPCSALTRPSFPRTATPSSSAGAPPTPITCS